MPHIHVEPDQHDMTVSAYIVLHEDDEWKCLVHLHRKMGKLMQVGGHIELNETPWQAAIHELEEETGYIAREVKILQPFAEMPQEYKYVTHPLPFSMNTHNVGDEHYHSDACYGFIAEDYPEASSAEGQSKDLRWLSIKELSEAVEKGEALRDVLHIYRFLVDHLGDMAARPVTDFSLGKPQDTGVHYKTGKPSELRTSTE